MGKLPEKIFKKIENNIEKIGDRLGDFPGCPDGNYMNYVDKTIPIGHIFNWTQSFFTGMALWAYVDSGEKKFLDWAESFKDGYKGKVFDTPMETMHDLGFLYSPYAVMLYNLTGNEEYKEIAVRAADALAMRYEPKGRYIRAWGRMDYTIPEYVDKELAKDPFFAESKGLTIIDSMMNVPLLFWASKVTGHPFYKRIAQTHADTIIKYFIKDDYSVVHAYRFSEQTGEPLGEANYCGYANGSYWSRGAAWAIYGFAIAYSYTGEEKYMDVSLKILERFMEVSQNKVPLWDFKLPEYEEQILDTAAASVALCGTLELQRIKKLPKLAKIENTIRAYLEEFINYDENVMGILKEQDGAHHYTPYGDYFLVEAYMKKYSDLKVW